MNLAGVLAIVSTVLSVSVSGNNNSYQECEIAKKFFVTKLCITFCPGYVR